MKIEVSDGEIVDKYSILCLKIKQIYDEQKKREILYEKELLHDYTLSLIVKWPMYYKLLYHVNQIIWDRTNEMKSMCVANDPIGFAYLASEIFSHNDKRFRLKRIFNMDSNVKEHKSYGSKTLNVHIPNRQFLLENLDRIIYLVLDYDHIKVLSTDSDNIMNTLFEYIPKYCISHVLNQETEYEEIPNIHDQNALMIINHFTKLNDKVDKQEG